jgi:hypothetical protein
MARQTSRLQQELKQNRPFRSIYQEAALSVMKTADAIRRDLGRKLEPSDITVQQYNVLRILRGAGAQGLPTLAIGDRLIEETPGMTRLLDRLEAKALVRRVRCEQDRRGNATPPPPGPGRARDRDPPRRPADAGGGRNFGGTTGKTTRRKTR